MLPRLVVRRLHTNRDYVRYNFRRHPYWSLGIAGVAVFGLVGLARYQDTGPYPRKIGLKVKTGLYYLDIQPDYDKALKSLTEAVELAESLPEDELVGLKFELVRCLQMRGEHEKAIRRLEKIKQDSSLKWQCRAAFRIAELDESRRESNLVWSVETALKNPDLLSSDEQRIQFEALGAFYASIRKDYYAAQLFMKALMMYGKRDCHAVLLMNNLAATIGDAGPEWAQRALDLVRLIPKEDCDDECAQGRVGAVHNLGRFAQLNGRIAEARDRYEEALSLAHAFGYEDGVEQAQTSLSTL